MNLGSFVRDIPDFPSKGIVYKDITPLLQDKTAFRAAINNLADCFKNHSIDLVLGIEARGFLLASAVAYALGSGLIIARKPGKLPHNVVMSDVYTTEYSTDILHLHSDAVKKNQNVLIIDDVLATGGTAAAAAQLINKLDGRLVGYCFLIELDFIHGRKNLEDIAKAPVYSLLRY
jgi:adenine phosphoribosyltransferase